MTDKPRPYPQYPVLRFFEFGHLPEGDLRDTSRLFAELADVLVERLAPDTTNPAELATALRKLLESKDAAVRAALV